MVKITIALPKEQNSIYTTMDTNSLRQPLLSPQSIRGIETLLTGIIFLFKNELLGFDDAKVLLCQHLCKFLRHLQALQPRKKIKKICICAYLFVILQPNFPHP